MASVNTFSEFLKKADFSLLRQLKQDPDGQKNGLDHKAREVRSGHYVRVAPCPLPDAKYVAHSHQLFEELGLDDSLVKDESFRKVFSGDLSQKSLPMHSAGWATGYALSIYGTEYVSQCPFGSGNGYGDGRAMSVFEGVFNGRRWEMQLKGSGTTPYCRGADGRAVLRSSVREFLVQEYMHALGVKTTRSLSLYMSGSEKVVRPWYSEGSSTEDPDIVVENPAAISTRVASSFLRVGQLELFARRARSNTHPGAKEELRNILQHLIDREYIDEIDSKAEFEEKLIVMAKLFRDRLCSLVSHWIRVGYCQGNFNSDNCAAGGFTLDYGPFGFCELFDPEFQSWTGGGRHFCFFNQPQAAQLNFQMFCKSLQPIFGDCPEKLKELSEVYSSFGDHMKSSLEGVWAAKLGLECFDVDIYTSLMRLMTKSSVDFTIFFRELSHCPVDINDLKKSFYEDPIESQISEWQSWLDQWRKKLDAENDDIESVLAKMKRVNPKYTWREWLIVPAYQKAAHGDFTLIYELQELLSRPYEEQSKEREERYYKLKPKEFFDVGGVSHYSCSS